MAVPLLFTSCVDASWIQSWVQFEPYTEGVLPPQTFNGWTWVGVVDENGFWDSSFDAYIESPWYDVDTWLEFYSDLSPDEGFHSPPGAFRSARWALTLFRENTGAEDLTDASLFDGTGFAPGPGGEYDFGLYTDQGGVNFERQVPPLIFLQAGTSPHRVKIRARLVNTWLSIQQGMVWTVRVTEYTVPYASDVFSLSDSASIGIVP